MASTKMSEPGRRHVYVSFIFLCWLCGVVHALHLTLPNGIATTRLLLNTSDSSWSYEIARSRHEESITKLGDRTYMDWGVYSSSHHKRNTGYLTFRKGLAPEVFPQSLCGVNTLTGEAVCSAPLTGGEVDAVVRLQGNNSVSDVFGLIERTLPPAASDPKFSGRRFVPPTTEGGDLGDTSSWFGDWYAAMACGSYADQQLQLGVRAPDFLLNRVYFTCVNNNGTLIKVVALAANNPQIKLVEYPSWVPSVFVGSGAPPFTDPDGGSVGELSVVSLHVSDMDRSLYGVFVRSPPSNATNTTTRSEFGRIETCVRPSGEKAFCPNSPEGTYTSLDGFPASYLHASTTVMSPGSTSGYLHGVFSQSLSLDSTTDIVTTDLNVSDTYMNGTRGVGAVSNIPVSYKYPWHYNTLNMMNFENDLEPPKFLLDTPLMKWASNDTAEVTIRMNEPGSVAYLMQIDIEEPIDPTLDVVKGTDTYVTVPGFNTSLLVCHKYTANGVDALDVDHANRDQKYYLSPNPCQMYRKEAYRFHAVGFDDEEPPNYMVIMQTRFLFVNGMNSTLNLVNLTEGNNATQPGGEVQYGIHLTGRPEYPVTVRVSIEAAGLAHVIVRNVATSSTFGSYAEFIFNKFNWRTYQYVAVRPVSNDLFAWRRYKMSHVFVSLDPVWNGAQNNTRDVDEVEVLIKDDDVPTVVFRGNGVNGTGNLTAAEGNHTAFVLVALSQAPESPVSFRFRSDAPSICGVGQKDGYDQFAVFNASNYNVEQKILLFPMHNDIKHNPKRDFTVKVSMSTTSVVYSTYLESSPPDITVTILDSNDAGVEILNGTGFSNLTAPIPRLLAEESSSQYVEIMVRLKSQPAYPVTVSLLESGATTSWMLPGAYTKQQLQFDPAQPYFSPSGTALDGWSKPRAIRVYGIADKLAEGQMLLDVSFVCRSEDPNYNDTWVGSNVTLTIPPLLSNTDQQAWNPYRFEAYQNSTQPMNITDNDKAGVLVLSELGPVIEERNSHNISVQLLTVPFRDVTVVPVPICTSAQICHGITFKPTSITWRAGTNPIEVFTVTAREDIVVTADSIFEIGFNTTSQDQQYNSDRNEEFVHGLVTLTVLEDDVLGVLIDPERLNLEEGAPGSANTFSVTLATKPQYPVEVTVFSPELEDGGGLQVDVIPGPSKFTITTQSWNIEGVHQVKVRARDDRLVESTNVANVCLSFVSKDPFYNGYILPVSGNPRCILAIILDNDVSNKTEDVETYILADSKGNIASSAPEDVTTETGSGVDLPEGAVQYLPGGTAALPFPTGSIADQPIPGIGSPASSFPVPNTGSSTSSLSNGVYPPNPITLAPGMSFSAPPGVSINVDLPAGAKLVPPSSLPGSTSITLDRPGLARVEPGWTVVLPDDAGVTVSLPSPSTIGGGSKGSDEDDEDKPDLFLNVLSGPMRIDFTTASDITFFLETLEGTGIQLLDSLGNPVPLGSASGGRIDATVLAGGSLYLSDKVKDVALLLPYDAVVGQQYSPVTVSDGDDIKLPVGTAPTPISGLPVGTVIVNADGTTITVVDPSIPVVATGGSTIRPPEGAVGISLNLPFGVEVGGTSLASFPGGSTLSYPQGLENAYVPQGSLVLDADGNRLPVGQDGKTAIPPGGSVVFPLKPDPTSANVPKDAVVAARAADVVLPPDLNTIKIPAGVQTSYIRLPEGTEIVAPDGTTTTVQGGDTLSRVPPGSTLTLPNTSSPKDLQLPLGSTFSDGSKDGKDRFFVPLPPGDSIRVSEKTTLYVPAGTTIRKRDGTIISTPAGGGVVTLPAGASVTAPLNQAIALALPASATVAGTTSVQSLDPGASFTTPAGGVTTTISLPPGTTAIDQYGQAIQIPATGGPVPIPPGSTVTLPDNTAATTPIRIPAGSEIVSQGGVKQTLATIEGGTTISSGEPFTAPPGSFPPGTVIMVNGTQVKPEPDGSYKVPEGALITVPADGPPATIRIPASSDVVGKIVKTTIPEGTSIRLPIVDGNFTVFVPPGTAVFSSNGKPIVIPAEGGWLDLNGGSIIEIPRPCPSPCEASLPAASEIGDSSISVVPGGSTVTIPDDGETESVGVELPPGTVVKDAEGNVVLPSAPGGTVQMKPGWTFTTPPGKPATIVLPTQGTTIKSPAGKESGANGASKNAFKVIVQEVSIQTIPSPPPPDQFELTSTVVNYGPSPTSFAKPVEIKIKVPAAYLLTVDKPREEILKELFFIYAATLELGDGRVKNPATNSQWSIVPGGTFSFRPDGSIEARLKTSHFSNYAVTRIKPLLQVKPYRYMTGYITHVEESNATVIEPNMLIQVLSVRDLILVKGAVVSVRSRSSARFQSYNISNPTDRLIPRFDPALYVALTCERYELNLVGSALASSAETDTNECIEWTLITKSGTVFSATWQQRVSDLVIEPIGGVSGMEGVCAKDQLEDVLQTIAYETLDKNPNSNNLLRKIDYTLMEVYVNSTIKAAERPTIVINPVDSSPDVLVSRSVANYFEGQEPLAIDPGITAIDYDSECLVGAVVSIVRKNVTNASTKTSMMSNEFNPTYERLSYDPTPLRRYLAGALVDPKCGGNFSVNYYDTSSPTMIIFTGRYSSGIYSAMIRGVKYSNSRYVFPPPSAMYAQFVAASLNITGQLLISDPSFVRIDLINRNNRPQVDRTPENVAKIFDVCRSALSDGETCIPIPEDGVCGTAGPGCPELVLSEDGMYQGMLRFVDYDEVAPTGSFDCAGSIGEANFMPNTTVPSAFVRTLFGERFEYIPKPNMWGNDVLLVSANDAVAGAPSSAPTAVRVKVLPVNDPPVAVDVSLSGAYAVYCDRVERWCQTVHFESATGKEDCLFLDLNADVEDELSNGADNGDDANRPRAVCLTRDILWNDVDGEYDGVFDYTLASEPSPYPDNPQMGSKVSMQCMDGVSMCDLYHHESCDASCYESGGGVRKGRRLFSYTPGERFLEMVDVEVAYDFFTFSVRDKPKCVGIDVADVILLNEENGSSCPAGYQYNPPTASNTAIVNVEVRFYDNLHNKPPHGLSDLTVTTMEGTVLDGVFPDAQDEHPQDVVYAIIKPPSLGTLQLSKPAVNALGVPRTYNNTKHDVATYPQVQFTSIVDRRGFQYTPLPFLHTEGVGYDSFTYAAIDNQGLGLMSDTVKTVFVKIERHHDVPYLPCAELPAGTTPSLNVTTMLLEGSACELLKHKYVQGRSEKQPTVYRGDLNEFVKRYESDPMSMYSFAPQFAAADSPTHADLRARAQEPLVRAASALVDSVRSVASMMPNTTRQLEEQAIRISALVEASIRLSNVPTVTQFNVSNTGQLDAGKRPYAAALASHGNAAGQRLFTKWNVIAVPLVVDLEGTDRLSYRVDVPVPVAYKTMRLDGNTYQRSALNESSLSLVQVVANPGNTSLAPNTVRQASTHASHDLFDRHFMPTGVTWTYRAASNTLSFEYSNAAALFAMAFNPRPGARVLAEMPDELAFTWRVFSINATNSSDINAISATSELTYTSPCQPGFIAASENATDCDVCEPGTFAADDTTMDQVETLGFSCRRCPHGTFSGDYGRTISCDSCPIGTFADREGLPVCSQCPVGMDTSEKASHRRSLCRCKKGSVELALQADSQNLNDELYPLAITTACYEAFESRSAYERMFGTVDVEVDANNTTQLGAACARLRKAKEGNRMCQPLENPLLRLNRPGLYYPLTFRGIYVDPRKPLSHAVCQPFDACLQHDTQLAVSEGRCGPAQNGTERYNSTAFGCRTCNEGSFRFGDHCSPCPRAPWTRAMIAALLTLIFLFMLRSIASMNNGFGALHAMLSFLQIQSAFRQLDLPFRSEANYTWKISSILNMDPNLLAPECLDVSASDEYQFKLYLLLALPLAMLFLTIARVYLGLLKSHLSIKYSMRLQHRFPNFFEEPDWSYKYFFPSRWFIKARYNLSLAILSSMSELEARSFVRTCTAGFILFLHWLYFSLCNALFDFFRCFEDEDGELRLYSNPQLLCYRGSHATAVPVVAVAIAIYPIGIVLISYILLITRQRVIVHREASQALVQRALLLVSQESYGFLYHSFEPRWFTFETVNLLRKVSLACVLNLLHNPIEKGCCVFCIFLIHTFAVLQFRPHITVRLGMFEVFLNVSNMSIVVLAMLRHAASVGPDDRQSVDLSVLIITWMSGALGVLYVLLEMYPVVLKAIADVIEMRQKRGIDARLTRLAKSVQERMLARSILSRTAKAVEALIKKARAVFDRSTQARISDYMAKANKKEFDLVKRLVNKLHAVMDTTLSQASGGTRNLSQDYQALTTGIIVPKNAEKLFAWMALHASDEEKEQAWQIIESLSAQMASEEGRSSEVDPDDEEAGAFEVPQQHETAEGMASDLRYDFKMKTWVANADGDPLSGMRQEGGGGEGDASAEAAAAETTASAASAAAAENVDYSELTARHQAYWKDRAKVAAQEAAKKGKEWGKRSRPRRIKRKGASEGGILPPSKEEFEEAAHETTKRRDRRKKNVVKGVEEEGTDGASTDGGEYTDATTSGDEGDATRKDAGKVVQDVVGIRELPTESFMSLARANGLDTTQPREDLERRLEEILRDNDDE